MCEGVTGFFERLRLEGDLAVLLEDIEGLGSAGWKRLSLRFRNAGYEPNMNITRIYVETERDPIEIRPVPDYGAIFVVEGKEYSRRGIGFARVCDGRFCLQWGHELALSVLGRW